MSSFEFSSSLESSGAGESDNGDQVSENDISDVSLTSTKFQPLTIVKIDETKLPFKTNVENKDNLQIAEDIIKSLVRMRQLSSENDTEPPANKRKTALTTEKESELVSRDISMEGLQCRELQLNPEIQENITRNNVDFKVKCYLLQKRGPSALTKTFINLLTTESSQELCLQEHVINSYILFFYRNKEFKNESICGTFKPEIFALTTGTAGKRMSKYADVHFSAKIEKRILEFPFQEVKYKIDSGPVYGKTEIARLGYHICFSIWDFMDKIVGNRTRHLHENSSLHPKAAGAFTSKSGKPLSIKFDIREKSMKIRRQMTLLQLGSTLCHFSNISAGDATYHPGGEEECDQSEFQMHDCLLEVTDCSRLDRLNNELEKVIESSMKEGKKFLTILTNRDRKKWDTAEKITMHARKNSCKRRSLVETWDQPPPLEKVLECLDKTFKQPFRKEWLDDVVISFSGTSEPLKKFIFRRFSLRGKGTYIYHFGSWIEITAQYLYFIERDFYQLVSHHLLEASSLPLLPWPTINHDKGLESNKNTGYEIQLSQFSDNKRRWKCHYESLMGSDTFGSVKIVLDDLAKKKKLAIPNNILDNVDSDVAAHLYFLQACRLKEEDYNASHSFLNKLLRRTGKKMITCDRYEVHNIELCDLLIWTTKETFLVHVKVGFAGDPIRSVCSQINIAAEHLYREQTSTHGTGMIKKYWDILTAQNRSSYHQIATKAVLEDMGEENFTDLFSSKRDIIFVLAYRDSRKSEDKWDDNGSEIRDLFVDMEKKIRAKFEKAEDIIGRLKKEEFLTNTGSLTNKFILEGKANKGNFAEVIKDWDGIGSKKKAQYLLDILTSGLPNSKSTIAKMEIIRLANNFKKHYWVEEKAFQLKVCRIDHQFAA